MPVPISNVTRRAVYAPSGAGGAGPYAFTFEILANTDIAVYKDDTLLTLTTHYTVTINANGTGSVTITATGLALAPLSPTQYAIVGNRTIARSTDFTTGGDFFANTLNDELDSQTIFAQQNAEGVARALQAPQTDPTTIDMTLPKAADRANKTLAFDAVGDPTLGISAADVANAVTYATNAANSATAAAASASAASSSASAASGSASTASTQASNASTSASNASTSASGASTSATNAAASASTATTQASNASSSATAAASSASAASTSASNASTSETNAAASASTATTQASNASTSATSASGSATTATTQAAAASTSATNAASSAAAAAASAASGMYSAVQDKSANYTVVVGDAGDLLRVTTTSGNITITLPAISTVSDGFKVAIVKWTVDANTVTVARSGSDTINGATSATIGVQYSSITFVADYETNQWFGASTGLGVSNVNVDAFSGNGSTVAFTLSGDPASENNTQVYVSGVYQEKDTYSVSGTTLTFSTAPPTGTSNIEVVWTAPLAIGTPSDGTVTTAKFASTTGSGAVVLATSPTLTGVVTFDAGTAALPAITTTGDTNTGIFFPAADTIAFTEGGAEAMRISSAGDVGIGTTSPSSILNVKSSAPVFRLETTGAVTSSGTASYAIKDSSGNDVFTNGFLGLANCYQFATTFANGFIRFLTGSQVEAMRIDSSGFTYTNCTSSVASVSSYSNIAFSGLSYFGIAIKTTYASAGSTFAAFINSAGTQQGAIYANATNTTQYQTSSDYRLKENIVPMTGALAKVAQLKPCTFKWKSDGSASQGFIAHELQEVVPECVGGEKDAIDADGNPKYQGIDTSFLVATLTAAIQELKALTDTQASTITALTARITALEN